MKGYLFILLFMIQSIVYAQLVKNFGNYDTTYNAGKMRLVGVTSATAYTGVIYTLSNLWYTDKSSFHFFNDNSQWNQMDKMGHGVTSYHEGKASLELLKWAGVDKKGWLFLAGMSGFIFQFPIEVLDGYSPEYGASIGDLLANLSGSLLVTSQHLLWDEQFIHPKYSYHTSSLAKSMLRPNTLGGTWNEQLLKDYNGQTYWLSGNLFPIINNQNFPKWICLSVGYGAENMLYGNPIENKANGYTSYRQFYLAPDIDFTRIKTNKKGLKILFYFLDIVKVPLPTIEFDKKGTRGYFFYF